MKIALVTAATWTGGAERVAITLANCWVGAGHAVRLVTFEAPGAQPAFELDTRVGLDQVGLMGDSTHFGEALRNNAGRVLVLRRRLYASPPDVVLAFMTVPNILATLSGFGAPWPTIISERIHPAHHPLDLAWRVLRSLIYPRAHRVVVQTSDIAHWFACSLNLATRVIPNPIDLQKFRPIQHGSSKSRGRRTLIAVGRLDPLKGYDLLIQAFARVAIACPDWDLDIYGEGGQRPALQDLVESLGMARRISLAGKSAAIEQVYAEADLFVNSSRYEGYPNAVQEALASGKAVIATDCPGATRELLGGGRYGVLVPSGDVDALAQELQSLMWDHGRRGALARSARDAVLPFEAKKIAQCWIELFDEVIERRRP